MIDFDEKKLDLDKLGPFDHLAVVIDSTTVASLYLLFQNIVSKNSSNRIIQGPQTGVKAFWRLHDLVVEMGAEGVSEAEVALLRLTSQKNHASSTATESR